MANCIFSASLGNLQATQASEAAVVPAGLLMVGCGCVWEMEGRRDTVGLLTAFLKKDLPKLVRIKMEICR